jgi:hypothetical protein
VIAVATLHSHSFFPQIHAKLFPHEVWRLDRAAAQQLLRQTAGLEGASLQPALLEVERAILAECGGLPLVIKLMGGQLGVSMALEDCLEDWKVIMVSASVCLNVPVGVIVGT